MNAMRCIQHQGSLCRSPHPCSSSRKLLHQLKAPPPQQAPPRPNFPWNSETSTPYPPRHPQAFSQGLPARALSGCRREKRPRAQMGKTFL